MGALIISGLTAFPLEWGTGVLVELTGLEADSETEALGALERWLLEVHEGLTATNEQYPFIAYGTDWLAFAHLVVAVFFIGVWRDPVRNVWVVHAAMVACIGVIPLALICGYVRGIPFFWRLIDCSFGVFGIVPLWLLLRQIRRME